MWVRSLQVAAFVAGIVISLPLCDVSTAQAQGKNILNFANKSGEDVVVRVFHQNSHKRITEVRVQNGLTHGTNIADGDYYIVSKYVSKTGKDDKGTIRFSKGDPFSIKPPAGRRSNVTITLHGVVDGNYGAVPSDTTEFDR